MRETSIAAALLAAGLLAMPAAAQEAAAPPVQAATDTPAPLPADPTDAGVINMILVKVNGAPILLSDLLSTEEERLPLLRQQFSEEEIAAQLPQLRRTFLIGLIDEKMMLQRADQLGITADANQVDSQIQRLREANGLETDEQFEAALASQGLTVEDIRDAMRKTLRQQRLVFEEVQRGIFVSESEMRRYYDDHPGDFSAPEQVRLEQLVFLTQGGDTPAVREQVQGALGDLRSGMSLQDVAAKYPGSVPFAEDPSFLPVSDLQDAIAEAVPTMPEGEYSGPVRSPFGYHIVKVVERQSQSVSAYDEVKDTIRNRLNTEKSQKRYTQYLGQLRRRTSLEILDPRYADIEETWKASDEEEAPVGSQ